MDRNSFPSCCGADILSQFGNTSTAIDQTKYTDEQIEAYLTKEAQRSAMGYFRNALTVVILNEEQYLKCGKVFEKLGYNVVTKAYHPKHANNLYLLTKVHFEFKQKENE